MTRVAAAFAVGAVAVCVSYAAQRLGSAYGGEVDARMVLATEHIPYFYRAALALLHGVVVGVGAGLAIDDAAAVRVLGRVPALVLLVVVPAALLMVAVP